MVLNTRDIEDSGTIFGFPVSIHKKKCWAFEKISSKISPIWRFGHLEPLCSEKYLLDEFEKVFGNKRANYQGRTWEGNQLHAIMKDKNL